MKRFISLVLVTALLLSILTCTGTAETDDALMGGTVGDAEESVGQSSFVYVMVVIIAVVVISVMFFFVTSIMQ